MFSLEELEFLAVAVDLLESRSRADRLNKAAMGMKIGQLQEKLAKEQQEAEKAKTAPPHKGDQEEVEI